MTRISDRAKAIEGGLVFLLKGIKEENLSASSKKMVSGISQNAFTFCCKCVTWGRPIRGRSSFVHRSKHFEAANLSEANFWMKLLKG